jgi:hypothetical protein
MPEIQRRVAEKLGDFIAGLLLDRINKQDPSWKPLAPATIAMKGSTKAWIDTGEIFTLLENRSQSIRISGTTPTVLQVGIFEHDKGYIANLLEYGTESYTIHPSTKKALHWGNDKKGPVVKSVHHPGIPARPLFRIVFDTEIDHILTEAQRIEEEEIIQFLQSGRY